LENSVRYRLHFIFEALKTGKKDRSWDYLPGWIRYLFYQNVISQFGVPNNRPVIAYAWSTANIDATLIV
jgi:hypothetical protein